MNDYGLPSSFGSRKRVGNKNESNQKKQMSHHFSKNIEKDIEKLFNKKYSFFTKGDKDDFCCLPDSSSLFFHEKWELQQFQELKVLLNDTKSKLNDLNLREWHQHTTDKNVAGNVFKKLRHEISPEFLTQAWCKMYECLMSYWLVPKHFQDGVLNSVHLCEAPGAFITALRHFLCTWYPEAQWKWLATTLNPYHERNPLSQMIQDDRFILHTLSNWTFGEDATGNLMDKTNLAHLQAQVQDRLEDKVLLVTADGSIDCQINPAEQEALVAPLHYCEAFTALNILQPGGSLVLKMFTLLECDSICLMYLLVCVFGHVNVFKPVKSKEGNSEVYVVCTEYIGRDHLAPWLPQLNDKYGPEITKAMFAEKDIPEEFKRQLYECCKLFADFQIEVIERNIDLYFYPTPQKSVYSSALKRQVAQSYVEHYELCPIQKAIVGNDVLNFTPSFNWAQRFEEGTFNDRQKKESQDWTEHIVNLWAGLQELNWKWPFHDTVCWFMFNSLKLPEIKVTTGQPVEKVFSSKFCNSRILGVFNQIPSAELKMYSDMEVSTSATMDVSEYCWDSDVTQCHRRLLQDLCQALQSLTLSKSLCVRGLPLLTQFSVAVIFLLAHSFYQVGISMNGNVFLCGYGQAHGSVDWIKEVLQDMSSLPDSKAVLSILPINILCDPSICEVNGGSFYACVSSVNNARLLSAIEDEILKVQVKNS